MELEEGSYPSSIYRHVERSETSPIQSKGETDPFRTDRILVVLSVAKDLRLTPKRDLKFFWGSVEGDPSHPLNWLRRGLFPPPLMEPLRRLRLSD